MIKYVIRARAALSAAAAFVVFWLAAGGDGPADITSDQMQVLGWSLVALSVFFLWRDPRR